ncbi:MAG: efflux RND transporter periplasmic adaptor subunit [Desulfuromusa sp.]|nr:efflux RND transporter periplasmic adaptor subunit [Desulfuromusa sp.]
MNKIGKNISAPARVSPSWRIKELLLAGIVLISLLYCPQPSAAEEFEISGFTEAVQNSALGLSMIGRVAAIKVVEGEQVERGQILLRLDQELVTLEVKLRKVIWENQIEIEAVTEQVKTLKKHLDASRELYLSTGSVPREVLENKELEYTFAVADLGRLEIAKQREKIEYDSARTLRSKRNLYAPFTGVVEELLVGIGESCDIDTPVIQLVDTSQGYFVANVELEVSAHLAVGQKVQLQLQTETEPLSMEAKIVYISALVDPASGLRMIKALFDNQQGQIVPGVAGVMRLSEQ